MTTDMFELDGKVVMISVDSGGICSALALGVGEVGDRGGIND